MYISENCNWTPYGHDASLDKELDNCLDNYDKIIDFLEQNNNYGLDKVFNYCMSHDIKGIKYVKRYIAKQGYGLDKLIEDEDVFVRAEVAEQGYGLDKLINDEDWGVREAVANQGYGLDILINDESEYVREAVARQIYGLDKLINDKSPLVRAAVAEQGYSLDKLINDEDINVIKALVEQEYNLDKFINYKDFRVRAKLAEQGYGLDKLVNDESGVVRIAVAKQGYGLDKLINDENWGVREEVAKQGYGLDKLVNDEDRDVRAAVAKQGFGLDLLINDIDSLVCVVASDYLRDNGYKSIADWAKANPDKVYCNNNLEAIDIIKDFVYKINDSNTLKIESSYESCYAFFGDNSYESYESNEAIIILTADTKVPLIKLEKTLKDKKRVYKFIVDITNEDDNNFSIKSIISSKEKFTQLVESTINALNEYPQFSKYSDDLEMK